MDHDQALTILKRLADGRDPETGQPFPPDSPYQRPDVIRALFHAVRELENAPMSEANPASETRRRDPGACALPDSAAGSRPSSDKPARPTASNAGKPWSKEEDEGLLAGFDAGQNIAALATDHGRSRIAIEARLAKFGKVPMPVGVRGGKATPHASDVARTIYATQP